MKRLPILLMLAAVCGFTQGRAPAAQKKAAAAAPAKWPIEALKVEGNKLFTSAQVVAVTGLKIGQMAGKADFDAARDRLLASGAFETAGYQFAADPNGKGYVATFQVTETPTFFPVHFQELPAPPRELEGVLLAHDPLFAIGKMPGTKNILARDAKWIEDYLASKGTPEKVRAEVSSIGPDQFEIVFRPDRNPPAVARIAFESADAGHKLVIPEAALQDAIWTSAVGMPYTEAGVREVLNAGIKPLYEARGRLNVSFPSMRTEPAKDVTGLKVTVTLDEGAVYTLGTVAIVTASPVDPAVLLKQGDFKGKDIANFARVGEGLERIRKALRRGGYLDAKVTSERKLNDEKKTVDVAVSIDPGPQYTMGKVQFTGLDLEGEAEMKRMWTLTMGKPFNPEYPDVFLKAIKDEGVFDHLGNSKADTKVNAADHSVDVTLVFKGDDAGKVNRRGRGGM
ncbi:MAG TPA: POTRA domain-containing protein [Candidatus Limnocylindrales bacterium]|nr:POTRA domain-containing protein [Candidatus Limnocylindrales bacterium]